MKKVQQILILDDHPLVRQGIKDILDSETDIKVAAEADNAADALKCIIKVKIDIAIVDLSLEGNINGIDFIKSVTKRFPNIHCIVLTMHSESIYVERSVKAGARGYVLKSSDPHNVIEAIRIVSQNEIYIGNDLSRKLLNKLLIDDNRSYGFDLSGLTDRELEIFELIGYGNSSKDIAAQLHIAHNTIDAHRRNIKEKLGFISSSELVKNAIQWIILKK